MCGSHILVPAPQSPSNIYDVYRVDSMLSASDVLEEATLERVARAWTHVARPSTLSRYGAELRPTSLWLPPDSGETITAVWRTINMDSHILRFTAPNQLDVLGTHDDTLGRPLVDWQSLPSCSIEVPRLYPEWRQSRSIYQGLLFPTAHPDSVRQFELSCRGQHRDPIVGACPISGTFFSSPNLEAEYTLRAQILCTVFYFE